MKSKEYSAETFEKFALQGTPSTILVDRKGILRDVSFGQAGHIEAIIQKLLKED
jgi:16S rRNA C1402 N4-methylase RsmH